MTRTRIPDLIAVSLAVLHAVMALTAASHESPTFDEPVHFSAGYSYWLRGDYRLDAESGNLPQRWATLPLLITRPPFVAQEQPSWRAGAQGPVGTEFLYDRGNDADAVLLQGRAMMAIVSGALCLLIYFWAKSLWGSTGGLVSVALAAFCPTLLGHGPLVTSDVTLSFCFAAAIWSYWRMLEKLTPATLLWAALSTAGLFVSKMSGVLILPMMGILVAVRIWRAAPLEVRFGRSIVVSNRVRQALILAAATAVIGAVVVLGIWATYGFRYSAFAKNDASAPAIEQNWTRLFEKGGGATEKAVAFARNYRLLPEAYLYGFTYTRWSAERRPAFLDGYWSMIGFGDFFPRALLYKTPLPVLVLLAAAAAAAFLRRHDQRKLATAPLWTLALVYGAFALNARLNIGHRHLLPLYPVMFVACGSCAWFFAGRKQRVVAGLIALLAAWQVEESLLIRPHYLAYFNQLAGGPRNGWKHLVDSSLDWGQDLPALQSWLVQHPAASERPLYLAYFGTGRPEWYGIHAIPLPNEHPVDYPVPLLGGRYCVSATTLQQVYSRAMGGWAQTYENTYQRLLPDLHSYEATTGDPAARAALIADKGADYWKARLEMMDHLRLARLCAALRHCEPTASAGFSILIFDVSDEEVNRALNGPAPELFPQVQVAGLR